ncbi:MAG: methyltransferase domain-containing protein [bacterium]|nr:methyltransferase domain-containing protein [bacterium]MCY4272133.1 methyltransferase domain-containing protein [bacterium]
MDAGRTRNPVNLSRDLAQTREFFSPRAAGWEDRHPDDDVLFRWAVEQLGLSAGDAAIDAGCGSGRALAPLRAAVGPEGAVLGIDATPAMLHEAARLGRRSISVCAIGDVRRLPVRDGCAAGILAAGLLPHLPDAVGVLREMARVARPGGRLGVFHPIGRLALAARHRDRGAGAHDMNIDPRRIGPLLAAGGWTLEVLDDADDHYLALAVCGG